MVRAILDGVAPLVGAWIEITALIKERWITKVAPLVGAWIEIGAQSPVWQINQVAPLVGAWIEIHMFPSPGSKLHRRSSCRSVD